MNVAESGNRWRKQGIGSVLVTWCALRPSSRCLSVQGYHQRNTYGYVFFFYLWFFGVFPFVRGTSRFSKVYPRLGDTFNNIDKCMMNFTVIIFTKGGIHLTGDVGVFRYLLLPHIPWGGFKRQGLFQLFVEIFIQLSSIHWRQPFWIITHL